MGREDMDGIEDSDFPLDEPECEECGMPESECECEYEDDGK